MRSFVQSTPVYFEFYQVSMSNLCVDVHLDFQGNFEGPYLQERLTISLSMVRTFSRNVDQISKS